jgi:hypothetical protein
MSSCGDAKQPEVKYSGSDPAAEARAMLDCLTKEIEKLRAAEKPVADPDSNDQPHESVVRAHYATQQKITGYLQTQQLIEIQVITHLEEENYTSALQMMSSLMRMQFPPECSKKLSRLNSSLLSRQKEQEEYIIKKVEAFQMEIGDKLLAAKKPSDLDAIIQDVNEMTQELSSTRTSHGRNMSSQLGTVMRIVTDWQEYLSELSVKDIKGAKSKLSSIISNLSRAPIVPRSKVLELQHTLDGKVVTQTSSKKKVEVPYSYESVVEEYTTLESLDEAEAKLMVLLNDSSNSSKARAGLQLIKKIRNIERDIQEGSILLTMTKMQNLSSNSYTRQWGDTLTDELYEKIYAAWGPKKYHKLTRITPIDAAIDKTAEALVKDEEWQLLWEYLQMTHRYINKSNRGNRVPAPWVDYDIQAIEKFRSAQLFEKAGEYGQAFDKYESVLEKRGRFGPYDAAIQAVKKLREQHDEQIQSYLEEKAKLSATRSRYHPAYRQHESRQTQQMIRKEVEAAILLYMKDKEKAKEPEKTEKEAPAKK